MFLKIYFFIPQAPSRLLHSNKLPMLTLAFEANNSASLKCTFFWIFSTLFICVCVCARPHWFLAIDSCHHWRLNDQNGLLFTDHHFLNPINVNARWEQIPLWSKICEKMYLREELFQWNQELILMYYIKWNIFEY